MPRRFRHIGTQLNVLPLAIPSTSTGSPGKMATNLADSKPTLPPENSARSQLIPLPENTRLCDHLR